MNGSGIPCRPHLLAAEPGSIDLGWLAGELSELQERLDRLFGSMTLGGPAVTAQERLAWVEALGWFTGWGIASTVAGGSAVVAGRPQAGGAEVSRVGSPSDERPG